MYKDNILPSYFTIFSLQKFRNKFTCLSDACTNLFNKQHTIPTAHMAKHVP